MVDWKNVVVPNAKEVLSDRRQQGVPAATLRGIFYILVSLGHIENIQQQYKSLSRALVTARRNHIIPYDWIVDESREIIDIYDVYMEPSERIRRLIDSLIDLPDTYQDTMPRWYKQPKYVEVWVEKNAMASLFSAILTESRQVRIVPNGGWSSESFMKKNVERLTSCTIVRDEKTNWFKGRDVYVLYYGDYDPTGLRMVDNLREQLEVEDERLHFEHVAITKEQIEQFGLGHLTNPDPAVMAKLERDSNGAAFKENNDGRVFQIELDALNALMPDDFIALLEDSVDRHFDESIHAQVMEDSKHSSETIWRQVRKSIKNFDKQ
jgi:hypothetical protein